MRGESAIFCQNLNGQIYIIRKMKNVIEKQGYHYGSSDQKSTRQRQIREEFHHDPEYFPHNHVVLLKEFVEENLPV